MKGGGDLDCGTDRAYSRRVGSWEGSISGQRVQGSGLAVFSRAPDRLQELLWFVVQNKTW